MIFSKNEKWRNSSILTKVSLWTMLLNTLLLLVSALVYLSWTAGTEYTGGSLLFFIAFFINALLSFGIFKVNGVARVFTILQGLVSVLFIVLFISGYKFLMASVVEAGGEAAGAAVAASAGLFAGLFKSLLSAIPSNVMAQIGFYLIIFIGPYILQLLSMLILFLCGKDFKKK